MEEKRNKSTAIIIVLAITLIVMMLIFVFVCLFGSKSGTDSTVDIKDNVTPAADGTGENGSICRYDTVTGEAPCRIRIENVISVNKLEVYILDENGNDIEKKTIKVVDLADNGSIRGALYTLGEKEIERAYYNEMQDGETRKPYYYFDEEKMLELVKKTEGLWIEYAEANKKSANEIYAYVWLEYPGQFTPDKYKELSYNYKMISSVEGVYKPTSLDDKYTDCYSDCYQVSNQKIELKKVHILSIDEQPASFEVDLETEEPNNVTIVIEGTRNLKRADKYEEFSPDALKCYNYTAGRFSVGDEIYIEIIDENFDYYGEAYNCNIWFSDDVTSSYSDFVKCCYSAELLYKNDLDPSYFYETRYEGYIKRLKEGY